MIRLSILFCIIFSPLYLRHQTPSLLTVQTVMRAGIVRGFVPDRERSFIESVLAVSKDGEEDFWGAKPIGDGAYSSQSPQLRLSTVPCFQSSELTNRVVFPVFENICLPKYWLSIELGKGWKYIRGVQCFWNGEVDCFMFTKQVVPGYWTGE